MACDGQASGSGGATGENTRPAVLVSGLHKTVAVGFRRRKVEILKGVDLVVQHNEVFGLLGPNGAGKTTTVKVALGLMKPTAGTGWFTSIASTIYGPIRIFLPDFIGTYRTRAGLPLG